MSKRYVNYYQYILGTADMPDGVLVHGELLTSHQLHKHGYPLSWFRVVRVPSDSVYWWFGARFSDSDLARLRK